MENSYISQVLRDALDTGRKYGVSGAVFGILGEYIFTEGAQEIVSEMRREGVKVMYLTGNQGDFLDLLLRLQSLGGKLSEVVTLTKNTMWDRYSIPVPAIRIEF